MKDNTEIPIHPERGIDPHLCCCEACGGEVNGIVLGVLFKGEVSNGAITYANRGAARRKSNREIEKAGFSVEWSEVTDTLERIPSGLCDSCEEKQTAENEAFEAIVKAGGCLFVCKQCGKRGAIRCGDHNRAFIDQAREHLGVAFGDKFGLEFVKCTEHGVTA